jgi:hypothetical protein
VFGFALSLGVTAPITTGASGAVFGVVGGLFGAAAASGNRDLARGVFKALWPMIAATFALGFLVPVIDNSAHAGGLLFGLALGYGISVGERTLDVNKQRSESMTGLLVLIGCAAVFVVVVAYGARPLLSPRFHAVMGVTALLQQDRPTAERHAHDAARLAPEGPATFLLLARLAWQDQPEKRVEAVRLAGEALARTEGDDPVARFQRAVALLPPALDDEVPWADVRGVRLLCDAALPTVSAPPADAADASARQAAAAMVENECAWLLLKAADPAVKDAAAALPIARQAVLHSGYREPIIVHTLAEALAQTADAAEGLQHLDRLAAEGHHGAFPSGFLDAERQRLRSLAAGAVQVGSP